jgi:hypothetical protein
LNSSLRVRLGSLLALSLICYCVFFYALGNYPLFDPDEGRSGQIAKEMVGSGNWLTLTHEGEPYYDKPAPYFWLLALGLKFSGLNEWPLRLPSALAACLTVAVVYLWGSVSGHPERGFWSGMVLATSMEFVALGHAARMDMLFTFFFTAALLSFLWWQQRVLEKVWIWLFYVFMALAVLVKGPVGLVLPLLIVFVARGLRNRWALVQEIHLMRGMVIVTVVAGSWYLVAAVYDPEYIWTFLWDHNVVRYFIAEKGENHPRPLYYFLPLLMGGYLPWSLWLPPIFYDLWRHRKEESHEAGFLFVWAAAVFVFFSLSRNKLGPYILPLFPPLALLTGDFLHRFRESSFAPKWIRLWVLSTSAIWLLLILALFPLSELFLSGRHSYLPSFRQPLLPGTLFILFLVVGWIFRRASWTPWVIALSSLWLVVWFYGAKASEIGELKSSRNLAQFVNGISGKEFRVIALKGDSFSFYLSRELEVVSGTDVAERMLHEEIPTVALVKEKHLRELQIDSPKRLFVWKSVPSENALLANFPPPPSHFDSPPPTLPLIHW